MNKQYERLNFSIKRIYAEDIIITSGEQEIGLDFDAEWNQGQD